MWNQLSEHVIRAAYSDRTVRVYQAYSREIAQPALAAGRFVPPFRMERMTWIKPSFNWMMYRSGYATKPGQQVVLGIDITREGFEWALEHAVSTRYIPSVHSSHDEWNRLLAKTPVRVQWDPERDHRLNLIPGVRAIQIGLSGEAVEHYANDWIVRIEDMTATVHQLAASLQRGVVVEKVPDELEKVYPLRPSLRIQLCRE